MNKAEFQERIYNSWRDEILKDLLEWTRSKPYEVVAKTLGDDEAKMLLSLGSSKAPETHEFKEDHKIDISGKDSADFTAFNDEFN